jgi:hypothetical protein
MNKYDRESRHKNKEPSVRTSFAAALASMITVGSTVFLAQDETVNDLAEFTLTSCNELAQRRFDRGMRYQPHSGTADQKPYLTTC